jgi:hypothetical protein
VYVNILGCVNIFSKKKKKTTLHCAIDHTTIRSIADTGLCDPFPRFCKSSHIVGNMTF